jgi:hypothetical protein
MFVRGLALSVAFGRFKNFHPAVADKNAFEM